MASASAVARVLEHVGTAGKAGRGGTRDEIIEAKVQDMIADDKHVCTQLLFPTVVSSRYFTGFFLGHLHNEIGLTKPQALRAYQAACLALGYAIGEFFAEISSDGTAPTGGAGDDGDIKVMVPGCFQDLRDLGPEAFAAKRWPDKGRGALTAR